MTLRGRAGLVLFDRLLKLSERFSKALCAKPPTPLAGDVDRSAAASCSRVGEPERARIRLDRLRSPLMAGGCVNAGEDFCCSSSAAIKALRSGFLGAEDSDE